MGGRTAINESGNRYGKLLVMHRAGEAGKQATWLCVCDCGEEVVVSGGSLRGGRTTSCGCYAKECVTTHGMHKTTTYSTWTHMKHRCYNESFEQYEDYGGRGIIVCDSWLSSFENFLSDMGERPEGMTLDRVDVHGNYCKENCRWASHTDQSFNQKLHKRNKSGKSGVYISKSGNWIAEIKVNYKKIHLGTFRTFDRAVEAREAAEIKYFGYNKE